MNELRQKMLHTMLQRHSGDNPDAIAVSEASINIWQQVSNQLSLIIGAGGVSALYNRSLYLTSKTYPWVANAVAHQNIAGSFAHLKISLQARETEEAIEASCHLMATYTALLADLIGEPLVERLLDSAWVSASAKLETRNKV